MRTKVYGRARPPGGSYIFAAMLVNCGHAASRHIVGGPSSAAGWCAWAEGHCVAVRHCVNVSLDNFRVTQFSCFPCPPSSPLSLSLCFLFPSNLSLHFVSCLFLSPYLSVTFFFVLLSSLLPFFARPFLFRSSL